MAPCPSYVTVINCPPSTQPLTASALVAHHPISIVVADDISFVEHLGNAGRPYRRRQPAQTGSRAQQCGSRPNMGLDSWAHTGNDA
jgi:hypothetical protein